MNGLMTQLARIDLGKQIEESHMRNRAMIARWVLEKGKAENVVELRMKDRKTYVVINDYKKLRNLFGLLLAEIQRIRSEGDWETAGNLVEQYAVSVDPALHTEVKQRYNQLDIAPYSGFVNPVYEIVRDDKQQIIDINISYQEGYAEQMLRYSKEYDAGF
jgi:dipeptidyl-peptidase-3